MWRRLASEGGVVYVLAFGIYLTIAVLLDLKYRTFDGDAFSRMANGFYILYSRDPHLAAVGFVWEPLQSIADMVFLLGNHLWPALSHNDMAGSLVERARHGRCCPPDPLRLARVGSEPRSPPGPDCILRARPHDPPLCRQRNERGSLPVHTGDLHALFAAMDATRGLTVAGLRCRGARFRIPDPKRSRVGRDGRRTGRGRRELRQGSREPGGDESELASRISSSSVPQLSPLQRAGPSQAMSSPGSLSLSSPLSTALRRSWLRSTSNPPFTAD